MAADRTVLGTLSIRAIRVRGSLRYHVALLLPMRRILLAGILIAASASLPNAQTREVSAVLADMRRALGGDAALDAVKAFSVSGTIGSWKLAKLHTNSTRTLSAVAINSVPRPPKFPTTGRGGVTTSCEQPAIRRNAKSPEARRSIPITSATERLLHRSRASSPHYTRACFMEKRFPVAPLFSGSAVRAVGNQTPSTRSGRSIRSSWSTA